jgi:hypothetical protein
VARRPAPAQGGGLPPAFLFHAPAPAVLGPEGALATDLLPGLSIPLAELF